MRLRSFPAFAALSLALSACGGGGDRPAGGSDLTGTIRLDGSSTVGPLSEAVAEEFMIENPGVRVTVGTSGTGGGFEKFARGETDISNASRPIKPEEAAAAAAAGIGYIELPVAYDGLAVVVHAGNDFVDCLTVDELRAMWEPGSTVNNWRQVRPGFPDLPLRLFGPGTDSGTYDYFTKAVVGEEGASRTDFQASEDDNVLVQGVAGDAGGLGFFGLAYYENNAERLKLLGIDDGDASNGAGCVTPSAQTVQDGSYQPLSRPEFIYVSAAKADDPAVQAFVRFYLANAGTLATEVGSVPLSAEAYAAAQERFDRRATGSVFGGQGAQVGVRIEDLLRAEGGAAPGDTAGAAAPPDTTAAPR